MTAEDRETAIEAEKDRLSAWAMNDDSASLSNILADLTSPEKGIRMAAIEATEQFGETNAIPVLKAAAANAEDNQEAIAMLEAADFISLPDVIFATNGADTPKTPEQIQAEAQPKAKAAARRSARMQKHAGNQNSQSVPGQDSTSGQNQ
jgi:HEAT repeat protein